MSERSDDGDRRAARSRTTAPSTLQRAHDRVFLQLLVNTLLVSVINFTVWFAITFWVYLETRSVLATGMVAGIFLVATVAERHLVRQPGRPLPQEDGHAGSARQPRWCSSRSASRSTC